MMTATTANDARTPPVAVWQILEKLRGQELVDWRVAPLDDRPSIAERGLDIGFPFGWYAIELADFVAVGEAKPLRYFDKDLAIWRGEDGQVRIMDAWCKHLGAHMGHGGKVHGNLLECPFHAWRYDGEEGVVRDIPYAKSIPPQVKRKCMRTWAVTEANGWIWTWYHPDPAVGPMWDVVVHDEVGNPDWTPYEMHEWLVYGSIQNMAENGVDVAHFKYIHGTANVPEAELRWGDWGRGADVKAQMGTPNGMVDGLISYDTMGPGQSWTRFSGISETLLVASLTPVSEDVLRVRYCFTQPRAQAEGPGAGLAKALIRDICKQLDQDKVIWDRMRFERNPIICEGDGPIPQFRRWYSRYYADSASDGEQPKLTAVG
ncbi:aromatic ring-hydroxylating oxygenase subunit alpha [Sphingomonas lacunae]|nr:Rieske 2Fe-2S domain-containing protein [Sphingomonas lacunae]